MGAGAVHAEPKTLPSNCIKFALLKLRPGLPLYHATYVNTPEAMIDLIEDRELPEVAEALAQLPKGAPLDDRQHLKWFSLLPELGVYYALDVPGMVPLKYTTKKEIVLVDLRNKWRKVSELLFEWTMRCGMDEKVDGFIADQGELREVILFRPYEVLDPRKPVKYAKPAYVESVRPLLKNRTFTTHDEPERAQLAKYLDSCLVFDIDPADVSKCKKRNTRKGCSEVYAMSDKAEMLRKHPYDRERDSETKWDRKLWAKYERGWRR